MILQRGIPQPYKVPCSAAAGCAIRLLSGVGAALFVVGAVLFLAGAFVWTKDARHGSISPAVYGGPCVSVVGIVLLVAAGLWKKR